MRILSKAAYITISLVLMGGLFTAFSKPAQAVQTQHLSYSVYSGGLNVVAANMDLQVENNKYLASVSAKTHGFLGKLAPWSGTFESNGRVKNGQFFPNLHHSVAIWRGEDDEKKYDYDGKGNLTNYLEIEAGKTKPKKDLETALIQDTTDILSATLKVMHSMGNGEACDSSEDIFDGKRRFALTFNPVSETVLKSSRYNIFDGVAKKCEVMIEPKGGKWHAKPRGWLSIQEQGLKHGARPTIWLGKLDSSDLFVPVKVQIKTSYGTLLMHLTESRVSGIK